MRLLFLCNNLHIKTASLNGIIIFIRNYEHLFFIISKFYILYQFEPLLYFF
ncbi:hypothetical protein Xkoz_00513 [Xenorhabdus kozodoii]|uniref:Uncharacterized protein n=1 Tax=Xenorhabdus kozodoii TaxID=351676 RepID=A0A2D0LG21_9GAMM|nr:hypothetical protein Xkoz_00513 [Xenorhabdus kozodoii]